jgi:preprotein translocase subunit SecF
MKIIKWEPNFRFMNKRVFAFTFSGLLIAVGVVLFFSHGFNLGVDFTGGTNIEISFRQDISVNQVRSALNKVGLGKAMIQRVGEGNRFFIKAADTEMEEKNPASSSSESEEPGAGVIKTIEEALKKTKAVESNTAKTDLNNISKAELASMLVSKGVARSIAEEAAAKVVEARTNSVNGLIDTFEGLQSLGLNERVVSLLKENTYLGDFTFLSVETVGPQVGHKMRQKVTLATVWAMLGMLIYIGVRFRFIFGISAVITLMHDVLITLTFILIFQVEFTLPVVAAILTIVGYSLNDTIVIFDRVRDNLKIMKRERAEAILDNSINQTLSRTLVTSGTTLLTVIALFLFGGEVIHAFSFTLLVGIVFGTYSSIYQSCVWLKIWERAFLAKKK